MGGGKTIELDTAIALVMKYYGYKDKSVMDLSYRQLSILIREMSEVQTILMGGDSKKDNGKSTHRRTTEQDIADAVALGCTDPEGLL